LYEKAIPQSFQSPKEIKSFGDFSFYKGNFLDTPFGILLSDQEKIWGKTK